MKYLSCIILLFGLTGGCVNPGKAKSPVGEQAADSPDEKSVQANTGNKGINYIVFGRYCGRCLGGNCAPMYKLDLVKKELRLDNSNHYNEGKPLEFSTPLKEDHYQLAADLALKIPDSLFMTAQKKFGCPNCSDQCGLYLEIQRSGQSFSFEIDNNLRALSGYILPYAEKLQAVIQELNKIREKGSLSR